MLAGIELGGTKCVCILGRSPEDVLAQVRVPTTDPETTFREVDAVLAGWSREFGELRALGIASFGPIDLRRESPTYGYITSTPKAGWSNTEVVGHFVRALHIPVGFDTDVNGAALAEGRLGAAKGLRDFAYITVGTGIGVGIVANGGTIQGCNHTELGHLRVVRATGDHWAGCCEFHGDCVEGLASGTAIAARLGVSAESLAENDPVWDLVASAIGQLLHALVLSTAPKRIMLGGGVMSSNAHLFARLRSQLQRSLNGYVQAPEILTDIEQYVVPAALGALAGPVGALVLADKCLPPVQPPAR
jgi:fructokinase